jgi:telomerase reverse transcriptase
LKHRLGEIETCAKPLGMSTTRNKKENKILGNSLGNNKSSNLSLSLTSITNTNTSNTSTPTEDPKSRVSSSLPIQPIPPPPKPKKQPPPPKPEEKSPSNIIFVRSRIFYAKPALTKKREVQFGLPHIHVLNRTAVCSSGFAASGSIASVAGVASFADHVLMYMFPRQFGLHNVFTSTTDKSKTTQLFHDYSSREEEIKEAGDWLKEKGIPKRLAGVREMVEGMVKRHQRTSYGELMGYYCPVRGWDAKPEGRDSDENEDKFTAYASNHGEVTAFVKAVVKRVIPGAFFGSSRTITTPDDTDDDSEAGKDKEKDPDHNKKLILATIERFIKLRKYESLSLHDCSQGLRLLDFTWLSPFPSSQFPNYKLSLTDTTKRLQLLHEFLYWLIDGFIIPLLRGHFYITESSSDRNRVFYFRHDVWRKLSEPAFERLKMRMFEEVKKEVAEGNKLGVSKIRLLPKEQRGAIRPIVNLRRRRMVWVCFRERE